MDILYLHVVILSVGGLWNLPSVFGETTDLVNILHEFRDELNNLKLSNERNERKIMQLERQVSECHTKYAELTQERSSAARIQLRLADIEHKVELNHQELLKRLEAVEMLMGQDHHRTDSSATSNEGEMKGKLNTTDGEHGPQLPGQERTSQNNKRIVPVTGYPHTNKRIAFTAYAPHLQGVNIGLEGTLPFKVVQTNEGQAFNPTTHIFTCPTSGIYYFANSVGASSFLNTSILDHQRFETQIVKDGSVLAQTYSTLDSNYALFMPQSFNSVVTVCNRGESVWVRIHQNRASHVVFSEKFTTFTGFILWEL